KRPTGRLARAARRSTAARAGGLDEVLVVGVGEPVVSHLDAVLHVVGERRAVPDAAEAIGRLVRQEALVVLVLAPDRVHHLVLGADVLARRRRWRRAIAEQVAIADLALAGVELGGL